MNYLQGIWGNGHINIKEEMEVELGMKQKITKKGYKKENRGITLVALVVTIVVLLILAGITITMLFGENGIIKKAQDAANATQSDHDATSQGLRNLENAMNAALSGTGGSGGGTGGSGSGGENTPPVDTTPTTSTTHTIANLTAATSENGKGYTWSELYDVSKKISKITSLDADVREITVQVGEKSYTVGIGDEATVYYNGDPKTVRLIGFNHDPVVDPGYGANKAGMTFEFVSTLGNYKMNGTSSSNSTNAGGWAATEMREYLNGYNSETADPNLVGKQGGESAKIKETSGETAETLKIKKVKKDYIHQYNSAYLNGGESTALMSGTPSEDYLWLLSCAEIWSDGKTANGSLAKGFAAGSEGSQYAFYKDISGLHYNEANDAIKKPRDSSSSTWWLRSPNYNTSGYFCNVNSIGLCTNNYSCPSLGVAPGFSI